MKRYTFNLSQNAPADIADNWRSFYLCDEVDKTIAEQEENLEFMSAIIEAEKGNALLIAELVEYVQQSIDGAYCKEWWKDKGRQLIAKHRG